jgi:hypothetical protein
MTNTDKFKLYGPAMISDPICQLRSIMVTKNISFADLGRLTGYSTRYVKRCFNGSEPMSIKHLVKFSLAMEVRCSISIE